MNYTMNYQDIVYNSSSDEVEAMRRALEIRTASREVGAKAWHSSGKETYVWETPYSGDRVEVETVTICESSGIVTYLRTEINQAC